MEHIKFVHDQEIKALKAKYSENMKASQGKTQSQYDELCADYREFQLRSRAEFMALFNEFEVRKRTGYRNDDVNLLRVIGVQEAAIHITSRK